MDEWPICATPGCTYRAKRHNAQRRKKGYPVYHKHCQSCQAKRSYGVSAPRQLLRALMRQRWGSEACWRCGWNEDATDVHRVKPGADGGTYHVNNGIFLCPNCHRLITRGKISITPADVIFPPFTPRSTGRTGEETTQSKRTADQVREARQLVAEGWKHREVAERFGVSRAAITARISGSRWKHVDEDV